MYKFKINKFSLNSGEGSKAINLKKLNIIIGPNNSGKSKLLKELSNILSGERRDIDIIADIDFKLPVTKEMFIESYKIRNKISKDYHNSTILRVYSNKNMQTSDPNISLESRFSRDMVYIDDFWEEHLDNIIQNQEENEFFRIFGQMFYQYLGTEEKLLMSNKQKNYGVDSQQINFLSSIRFNEKALKSISSYTKEMFNKDIYLDTETLGGNLSFRVGKDFDFIRKSTRAEIKILNSLRDYKMLDEQGDGIKSFVTTYLTMSNQEKDVILIDEPENSLHPPLARKMGEMIGKLSNDDKQLFISTHSAEVIKGILSRTDDVNIIRITQPEEAENTVTLVKESTIKEIIEDPMLRVSRVIEGLFSEKVVITESEADELIYEELISKIGEINGLFFVHGHGKQTIYKIANLYKEIGVDYAMVFDFDLIRVKDDVKKVLNLANISQKQKDYITSFLQEIRDSVVNSLDTTEMDDDKKEKAQKNKRDEVYKKKGLGYFQGEEYKQLLEVLELFKENKIHVLKTGELETTLESLGIEYSKNKNKWIIEAINRINTLTLEEIQEKEQLYEFLIPITKINMEDNSR